MFVVNKLIKESDLHATIQLLDHQAEETNTDNFVPRSQLEGPINALGFLQKSVLFAELSKLAYLDRADAGQFACQIGLPEVRYYDRDGAQAYVLGNIHDVVVVCRGTEPDEWNDVKEDFDVKKSVSETVGWVHRGFKYEVDELWPRLEQALVSNGRTLWFTGHSLGGAMATICAGRCKLSVIRSNPRALFTYGAPRVGNKRYVNYVKLECYRWVNHNDIVPHLPPAWLGYRHSGLELYLSAKGQVRPVTGWKRSRDQVQGILRGLVQGRPESISDHLLDEYIKHLRHALRQSETGRLRLKLPITELDR